MNIVVLQTFLTVVRTGNLNRAANELNVTQSAVTSRLDALEQFIGRQLLVRSRKGAALTKAGYALMEHANVIVKTWQNAQAKINLPRGATRIFSLVCDPNLWYGLADGWVDRARKDNPEIAFDIWQASTDIARQWLQNGMSDVALLTEPLVGPEFEFRLFSCETLVQASTEKREMVEWHENYVYVDYGDHIRSQHAEAWPNEQTAKVSFASCDWALSYILKYGGSAYLPLSKIQPLLDNQRLFLIDGSPSFKQRTFLTWKSGIKDELPWVAAPDNFALMG